VSNSSKLLNILTSSSAIISLRYISAMAMDTSSHEYFNLSNDKCTNWDVSKPPVLLPTKSKYNRTTGPILSPTGPPTQPLTSPSGNTPPSLLTTTSQTATSHHHPPRPPCLTLPPSPTLSQFQTSHHQLHPIHPDPLLQVIRLHIWRAPMGKKTRIRTNIAGVPEHPHLANQGN
jgi:hypothetical protein